jgi:hypothetical protein
MKHLTPVHLGGTERTGSHLKHRSAGVEDLMSTLRDCHVVRSGLARTSVPIKMRADTDEYTSRDLKFVRLTMEIRRIIGSPRESLGLKATLVLHKSCIAPITQFDTQQYRLN